MGNISLLNGIHTQITLTIGKRNFVTLCFSWRSRGKRRLDGKKKKEIACQVFRKCILCVFVFARRFVVRSTSALDKTKQNGSCLDLLGVLFHDWLNNNNFSSRRPSGRITVSSIPFIVEILHHIYSLFISYNPTIIWEYHLNLKQFTFTFRKLYEPSWESLVL